MYTCTDTQYDKFIHSLFRKMVPQHYQVTLGCYFLRNFHNFGEIYNLSYKYEMITLEIFISYETTCHAPEI